MCKKIDDFDFHVTVYRDKFLIIKPTRCTNFSNLFLERNSTCCGRFLSLSSGVFHCTRNDGICYTGLLTACEQDQDGTAFHPDLARSCQQTCITYTIAVCTVENSWWWTEELSDTCRVSFQNKFEKLVHLVGFIIRKISHQLSLHCPSHTLHYTLMYDPDFGLPKCDVVWSGR